MGVLDKFLSVLKLNDDYDEDDDFLDEEDDFEETIPKKKGLFGGKSKKENDFDDFDDEDEFEDEPIIRKSLKENPKKTVKTTNTTTKAKQKTTSGSSSSASGKIITSKVSPIRTRKSMNDMSLCVVKPKNMEDAREITETLISNCTVVLNLEGIDIDLAQRIVDFTSGSIYALGGGLQRVSNTIFIITPASVDISGDITDLLNGAFDIPSINTYDY